MRFKVCGYEPHQLRKIGLGVLRLELARFQSRRIEQVVHALAQKPCVAQNDFEVTALRGLQRRRHHQLFDRAEDQCKRRTKLVTDVREELASELVELLGLLVHRPEISDRGLQLDAALPGGLRSAGQRHGVRDEPRQQQRGSGRNHGRNRSHGPVRPVFGNPDDVDVEQVGDAA